MKFKLLITGFLLSILFISTIGFFALDLNKNILTPFQKSEQHFQAIATAAAELTSYAKRAEGHLMLYLALHKTRDREKFHNRVSSLYEQITTLDNNIKNPDARKILEHIIVNADKILPMGNQLIASHDSTGKFNMESHEDEIFNLHYTFADIRQSGVDLTTLEIKLENDLRLEVMKNAENLQYYLQILIAVTSVFALYLGFTMINMISRLNREITDRKHSEKALQLEQIKLQQALSKVKTLSGFIPICSSCKKIRDDKGYWNQIENYIKLHSEADFSHSLCPDCIKELYSDVIEDNQKNETE